MNHSFSQKLQKGFLQHEIGAFQLFFRIYNDFVLTDFLYRYLRPQDKKKTKLGNSGLKIEEEQFSTQYYLSTIIRLNNRKESFKKNERNYHSFILIICFYSLTYSILIYFTNNLKIDSISKRNHRPEIRIMSCSRRCRISIWESSRDSSLTTCSKLFWTSNPFRQLYTLLILSILNLYIYHILYWYILFKLSFEKWNG